MGVGTLRRYYDDRYKDEGAFQKAKDAGRPAPVTVEAPKQTRVSEKAKAKSAKRPKQDTE